MTTAWQRPDQDVPARLLDEAAQKYTNLLNGAVTSPAFRPTSLETGAELRRSLEAALALPVLAKNIPHARFQGLHQRVERSVRPGWSKDSQARWWPCWAGFSSAGLGKLADPVNYPASVPLLDR